MEASGVDPEARHICPSRALKGGSRLAPCGLASTRSFIVWLLSAAGRLLLEAAGVEPASGQRVPFGSARVRPCGLALPKMPGFHRLPPMRLNYQNGISSDHSTSAPK